MSASGGAVDPNQTDTPYSMGSTVFINATGRTQVDPRAAPATTKVFILVGQSTIGNTESSTYTITNPTKIDNLFVDNGAVYRAADPLLGGVLYNAGGCWASRFADKLIADGAYQRIILVPLAIGGSTSTDWSKAGSLYQRLRAAFYRCAALGYTNSMINVLWQNGEADNVNGMSQATCLANMQSMIGGVRAEGFSSRWFVSQCSYYNAVTSAAIRAAQAAILNGTDIFSLGDSDVIPAGERWDVVHFNSTGSDHRANIARTAYYAAP